MIEVAKKFQLDGEPCGCVSYGGGLINSTFRVVTDTGAVYILQTINKSVFSDPKTVMDNIAAVTKHLGGKTADRRSVMQLIYTKDNDNCCLADGEYWRVFEFVKDSICYDLPETPADFFEGGVAFGKFQRDLTDIDLSKLSVTIPRFHDTAYRYEQLKTAVLENRAGRVKAIGPEFEFALKREDYAHTLARLQASGELPTRVTHNDTKFNNVLLDKLTRRALCVIDLDTVMPGLSVTDFGDAIRSGASSAGEDEPDPGKVSLSLVMFEAFARGFVPLCGLTGTELECLRDGAKTITLEQGIRFLTDYINGDTYYRTKRENQNLDRCRTQFKLVTEMEKHWDAMHAIIMKAQKEQ